ncbi:MAG: hypothetical protein M3214_04485 [Actinomycetota bacterium]|nr:hypothetical protein [Actinomycetota bacterium]
MHPLLTQDIARAIVTTREAEAARHRLAARTSRPRRVRRVVGLALVAAGHRLVGV